MGLEELVRCGGLEDLKVVRFLVSDKLGDWKNLSAVEDWLR